MAVSLDLHHALKLDPRVTRMLDVFDEGLQMWETQSISRIFKVASRTKILARRQGVTLCPMLDSLRTSSNLITSPAGSASRTSPSPISAKRKAPDTGDLDPDTLAPSRKRHRTPESPSPKPVMSLKPPSRSHKKFIQVPHGCTWPDGLLVHEVVDGFALMARTEGDQATKFCTVFKGATWSKPTFSRHKALWKGLPSKESEAALRLSGVMWKDLYKKVKRER